MFFFQAEDGIRDAHEWTGVQTCALPICRRFERDVEPQPFAVERIARIRQGARRDARPDRRILGIEIDRGERLPPQMIERSDEHTSELQSLMRISYAVFCLKKKKQQLNIPLSLITLYVRISIPTIDTTYPLLLLLTS